MSAKKWVVEPSATVGLGLHSAAIHDVSYDSHFTASEFNASKPWLVMLVKESDCKVTDYGSHVQRVLTRTGGNVEKHIVTLNEEKGEVTFVEGNMTSARVMLAMEIEESTFISRLVVPHSEQHSPVHCENVQDCRDANACLPGTRVDKIRDYSCSSPSGYAEGFNAEYKHDCNRKNCGAPVATDNADHTPFSPITTTKVSHVWKSRSPRVDSTSVDLIDCVDDVQINPLRHCLDQDEIHTTMIKFLLRAKA